MRGLGGVDPETRTIGSYQEDAFQGHWHREYSRGGKGPYYRLGGDPNANSGLHNSFDIQVTREAISDGEHGDPRIASETRPKNAAVNYIIKI